MAEDWERDDEPRSAGPGPVRLLAMLGGVVAVAMVVGLLTGGGGDASPRPAPSPSPSTSSTLPPRPIGADSLQRCPVTLGGLALTGRGTARGTAVERWQCSDAIGLQGAIVRRKDGSLGEHGAVVTWPITAEESTPTGLQATAEGKRREFVWPVLDSYARIRGDLSERELLAIANTVIVMQGVLLVGPPDGFSLVYNGRYNPELEHEIRYGSASLGRISAFGDGMVFTGLQSAAAMEDRLYEVRATYAGPVGRHRSVLSRALGNGAIMWEPSPGLVAYVGYSGVELDDEAFAALRALASTAKLLTPAQFTAASR